MPATAEAVETAIAATRAADDKKATDLEVLEVADLLVLVDLFALVTTANERHLKAVSEEIQRVLREEHDRKPLRVEGAPPSGWLLLDYGDVVVHLFSADQRDFYSLERLWADVPRRDPQTGEVRPPASSLAHAEADA